jgi:hypothetical protein
MNEEKLNVEPCKCGGRKTIRNFINDLGVSVPYYKKCHKPVRR